jgi:hypothetical protein
MDETYLAHMMELCASLGAARYHGHTHCEEEALLYQQLCRTITKKAKIDEMTLDATMDDIRQKLELPPEDGGDTGAPA